MQRPPGDAEQLPLSFGQEQLWFLDQLDPGHGTYNIPLAFRLRGPLDVDALARALNRLLARHEALRATFASVDGEPVQVIAEHSPLVLDVEDVAEPTATDPGRLQAVLDDEAARPFDITADRLLRARVLRLGADDHVLCLNVHHIAADGWSVGLLTDELADAYAAAVGGGEPALDDIPVQYGDFVLWQRDWLQGDVLEEQLRHWEEALAGAPVVDLPADRPRPARPTFAGDVVTRALGPALGGRLAAVGRANRASLLMVLTAAVDLLLARYTGEDDLSVGTTMLGRTRPELEKVVGLFINMVVLRVDASGDPTFEELLGRVRDATLAAYDHQDVPFEKVVGRVEGVRDPSRNPLFQVAVQLLKANRPLRLAGLHVEPITRPAGGSRFDLALSFTDAPDGLRLAVEYSTDLFDRWRIEQLVDHLERALTAVADAPSLRVSEVPLLGPEERDRLMAMGRGEDVAYPRGPVHTLVAERVRLDPDAVAVVHDRKELTYGELDRGAQALAVELRARGARHGDIVGVALDRSLDVFVALLGVLKAGAAFVVLDPGHPAKRLAHILRDTAAPVVLTRSDMLASLPEPHGWAPVCLDTDRERIEAAADSRAGAWEEWATPDSLAYVVYTSGSTGEPKGVPIDHRGLMLFVTSFVRLYGIGPDDRLLQYASLIFDLSLGEIFGALTTGASLVTGPPDTLLSPPALAALIREHEVTYVGAPPAMLAVLEPGPYPSVRAVFAGGEALSADLVNRWNLPGRTFVNAYGPTEAAIGCTAHVCERRAWRSPPPIGRPLEHRRLYVVDRSGDLAPVGVPGELLIGGDEGLSRGYLNQPGLTDARFVPDPFRLDGRAYRSGDLVRWTPDGVLEFVGRMDNQVKLRGLRIELDEIATVLEAHPHVGQAVVTMREDRPGQQRLVAYLVASGPPPDTADLRSHVEAELPAYMVPSAWVTLDALPLTRSGKVDRSALPAPTLGRDDGAAATPLATETERTVGAVLVEVLGVPGVGADDNFFDLGGTSLQAVLVLTRLADLLGVSVAVRAVYGAGSVRSLAAHLDELLAEQAPAAAGEPELDLLDQVETMSDEEVARLLAELDAADADAGADEGAGADGP